MTTTEAELERLRADIQKLRADFEHLGETLGRVARAGAGAAAEGFCDATKDMRHDFKKTVGQVTEKIEDNPLMAAVAAFGIGMLLAGLFSGRRT